MSRTRTVKGMKIALRVRVLRCFRRCLAFPPHLSRPKTILNAFVSPSLMPRLSAFPASSSISPCMFCLRCQVCTTTRCSTGRGETPVVFSTARRRARLALRWAATAVTIAARTSQPRLVQLVVAAPVAGENGRKACHRRRMPAAAAEFSARVQGLRRVRVRRRLYHEPHTSAALHAAATVLPGVFVHRFFLRSVATLVGGRLTRHSRGAVEAALRRPPEFRCSASWPPLPIQPPSQSRLKLQVVLLFQNPKAHH